MKSFVVLCAFDISEYAFKENACNVIPFIKTCKDVATFPHCEKVLVLTSEENEMQINSIFVNNNLPKEKYKTIILDDFTAYHIFSEVAKFAENNSNFDHVFFLYADQPCIDANLTKQLFENHIEYRAEYSFVDGYPEGFAPEIMATGLCKILSKICEQENSIVERNFIFEIIKKEINNYDIETLIAPVDLRHLRLRFATDTKRNSMLCERFPTINAQNYSDLILKNAENLFTIPAYYSIEVCNQLSFSSIYKPSNQVPILQEKKIMSKEKALLLIEKIAEYSDDAVISLSIFGEPSLYPHIIDIIEKILSYPKLSVLLETSGLHWTNSVIEKIKKIVEAAPKRKTTMLPIYWIIAIDAVSSQMYAKVHSLTEDDANLKLKQAVTFADSLNKIFINSVWTQIVRMNENEIEVEPFYRFWKDLSMNVIIQKFDSYCKTLKDKRVADLSPFERNVCWHIKRDMYILPDGTVPLCKEDIYCKNILGNAFTDDFAIIRKNMFEVYKQHLTCEYSALCGACDEYYTYNF